MFASKPTGERFVLEEGWMEKKFYVSDGEEKEVSWTLV